MPGRVLFVEGELDAQVLGFLAARTGVSVERGGPKSSLAPKARERREKGESGVAAVLAWYVRDRDFDFDAPEQRDRLAVDRRQDGDVLGWRWCRHSIESYLLDPRVVEAATGWPVVQYTEALRLAGRRIAGYTAVRWALGSARAKIDAVRLPTTLPWIAGQGREFWLPGDLSLAANKAEGIARVREWRDAVAAPDDAGMGALAEGYFDRLDGLASAEDVLTWHSGKDLLAALTPWRWQGRTIEAGTLRVRLRDWVREHVDEALSYFPEWSELSRLVAPRSDAEIDTV